MNESRYAPAQIDPETHRKLLIVSRECGLPIYMLIKYVCAFGFANPERFGISRIVAKAVKDALTNSS